MSDPERLDLRDLPPVEPIQPPSRLSQTFLRHADRCMRSAYLYTKYRGGAPSHPLDRGTAFHLFAERATNLLLERNEPRIDPDTAKVLVDEVLRDHPQLGVTVADADALRVMAYHWSVGFAIDPAKVVGVERKFVLDLGGWELVGKVDLASLDRDVAQVDDYKSGFALPSEEDYSNAFQPIFYAALMVFGQPVAEVPCKRCVGTGRWFAEGVDPADVIGGAGACEDCDGRGVLEQREPPIGERVQWVRARELYPRYLRTDGDLQYRSRVLSRTDLTDFRHDLERLVSKVDGALASWKWPAVRGSHCSECPCEAECPLPTQLRRLSGRINSMEEAAEAAEWIEAQEAPIKATKKELKVFAGAPGNGPVRFGADRVMEFRQKISKQTDWEGLEEAVQRAALYGEPFDIGLVRKERAATEFRARTLTPAELEEERHADAD